MYLNTTTPPATTFFSAFLDFLFTQAPLINPRNLLSIHSSPHSHVYSPIHITLIPTSKPLLQTEIGNNLLLGSNSPVQNLQHSALGN
jgi:hypothetical protein